MTSQSHVRDWMTEKPVTVREDGAALEALDAMVEQGIRHLPVVDEASHVIGVLSIDDLRAAFPFDVSWKRSPDPGDRSRARDLRISDAMTWAPLTVQPDTALEHAVRLLSEHRIGCLPVVDGADELVGILSETDALRALDALLRSGGAPDAPRSGAVESLLDELRAERERLEEQVARWNEAEDAVRDQSREPGDLADHSGVDRALVEIEPLTARAERRLRAIELALDRAQHGLFGICERCQRRIPLARLRAIPEATLCARCARGETD